MPLQPSQFDAAIVDLDGTMVDTQGDFVAALNAMLADLSLPPVDRAFVSVTVGKGSEYLVSRTLEHVGDGPGRYALAFDRYQHHYAVINGEHSAVYAGVAEGLTQLRGHGLKLACRQEGAGRAFCAGLRRRCLRAQEARPAAAAGNLQGPGHGAGAHADDRGLQQRRPGGPRGRMPGGAGQLRLQPRRTRARRGLRWRRRPHRPGVRRGLRVPAEGAGWRCQ